MSFAFIESFLASANHCSVKYGSIIEFDLSPYGTLFLIFSSFTSNFLSESSFKILFLASNLSRPIYSLGALSLIFPASVKIFMISRLFL